MSKLVQKSRSLSAESAILLNQTLNHTFSYFEPTINLAAVNKVAPEEKSHAGKKSRARNKKVAPEKRVAPEGKSRASIKKVAPAN